MNAPAGVLAVGAFDGIHAGHLAVIRAALEISPDAGVACFEPLPRQYFSSPDNSLRLTTPAERSRILARSGVRTVTAFPFDDATRDAGPDEFLEMLRGLRPFAHLVVGYDFHFGRGRSGSVAMLGDWCAERSLGLTVVDATRLDGDPVKSETVRCLLRSGYLERASRMLTRRYSASGPVARGRGEGRRLGFPTLNAAVPRAKLLPPPGSYAVSVRTGGLSMPAAAFIPEGRPGLVEAHIPGWSGDLYGAVVEIEFVEMLRRPEKLTKDELMRRIEGDVERTMEVMKE
ncbi:hypothetical protein GX411_11090 [Candidatus Fermentibacteria bacterium]|nr:hypothetical protein [Candidatus Fermentibacteria bacterium]